MIFDISERVKPSQGVGSLKDEWRDKAMDFEWLSQVVLIPEANRMTTYKNTQSCDDRMR